MVYNHFSGDDYMTNFVLTIFLLATVYVALTSLINRIPSRGRSSDASGERIEAVITNENRTAEKNATMKLCDANGRKYRVRLKADEARLWIKGDSVEIILSDKKNNYRVLFNDYFRINEDKIRKSAAERLQKKISFSFAAARLVGYTKENSEAFINSGADSRVIFIFTTYMHMIDVYSIVSFLAIALFFGWFSATRPNLSQAAFPFVVIVVACYMIYSAVMACRGILKKYTV